MAYTKTPVQSTHNVDQVRPGGTPFVTANHDMVSDPLSCNYYDCFPMTEKMWQRDPRVTVQRRQGWKYAAAASGTVASAGVMGKDMVVAPDPSQTNVFFTKSNTYYMFNYSTKAVSTVTTSTTASAAQTAAGCDAIDSSNIRRICWLDASNELKTFLQDGTSVTTTSLAGLSITGTAGLVFINGYLFAVDSTGTKIYNSAAGNLLTTWNSTDWLDAEMYGDPIVQIEKHKNYLVAFGSNSTEFFYDAGIEVGSPLARQESYACQIGLFRTSLTGRNTCRIGDEIYFLGNKANDSIGLFKISNFRVEEIENHWLQGILNEILSEPNTELMDGLEVVIVNNLPMVMINTSSYSSYNVMYSPKDDAFWLMRRGDPTLVDYPSSEYRFGRMFYSSSEHIPMFLGQLTTNGTAVQYWLPDYENTQTLTGKIFTPIIDFGNNRRKHLARVDVLGDFGVNSTITLKAYKGAGYSDGPETAAPSRTTTVYDDTTNPISFYNFGTYRRFGLVTEISGVDQWQYEGLEIEYNLGMD